MDTTNSQVHATPLEPTGIVSVNSRGGTSSGNGAKIAFALAVIGLAVTGAIFGVNKYHAAQKERAATIPKTDPNAAPVVTPRKFSTDTLPLPGAAKTHATANSTQAASTCADGGAGQPLIGPEGRAMTAPSGQVIKVCADGRMVLPGATGSVPAFDGPPATATPLGTQAAATAKPSRYGGDIVLPPSSSARNTNAPTDAAGPAPTTPNGGSPDIAGPGAAVTPVATARVKTTNSQSTGSDADAVSATMIGNRDMILPQGRSIDCNLSVRLVSEIAGKATCVLSSNVYSDSGRVVLAERGSVATGEYVAALAQGQRRLYVLWTRLQTPKGVIIHLNSPGADALGTSGLPGYVDNRWAERIGAAFLLSMVEDAIGYQTAKASSGAQGGGAQGVAVFQSTTQTGHSLAEKVLESTINIKPTVYKNQGDRATIFVSRDLDFGGVYALRAR